ncbi:MAG: hypothetical protein FWE38_01815 [Firmicutes bacterium]|nr:hypothetical protein [Bacillota bacterium]
MKKKRVITHHALVAFGITTIAVGIVLMFLFTRIEVFANDPLIEITWMAFLSFALIGHGMACLFIAIMYSKEMRQGYRSTKFVGQDDLGELAREIADEREVIAKLEEKVECTKSESKKFKLEKELKCEREKLADLHKEYTRKRTRYPSKRA